jgi:hypothetical protein
VQRKGLGQGQQLPTVGNGGLPQPKAPTPPPWDSRYESEVGGGRRKYLDTINNLDAAERAANAEFGIAPGFNDYQSNPYSRAALLESKFQEANRGSMNSAGLQLYSGSTGDRLAANRSGYDLNRDALAKQYNAAIQDLQEKRATAKEAQSETEDNARYGANERAEKAPLDSTQAPKPKGKGKNGKKHK